uniref:Myb42 n=1 Tax=Arundo donax TaxID=35708 RepID=A0A0A9EN27_ARUDO
MIILFFVSFVFFAFVGWVGSWIGCWLVGFTTLPFRRI